MKRNGWLAGLIALFPWVFGCSGAGTPRAEADWEPGRYVLEATLSSPGVRAGEPPARYQAELMVSLTGALTLTSSTGICRDPTFPVDDRARGERTFECGEATYRLRPGPRTVTGQITAPIVVERTVTECVRYTTNSTGQQVCAEFRERVERSTRLATARLNVHAEPGR